MEAVAGILGFLLMMTAFVCAFFLAFVQPIWGIVDVAVSPRLSGGAKAALIILTLVLLGPFLTFFYALFGTHCRGLKRTTVAAFAVGLVSTLGVVGLAALQPPAADDVDGPLDPAGSVTVTTPDASTSSGAETAAVTE